MRFTFQPMDAVSAQAITTWRYDGPYAVYDIGSDADDAIAELVEPASPYFAARDATGALVGYCCFGSAALVWDVSEPFIKDESGNIPLGLGLRPDLTGRGMGLSFVRAIMTFAQRAYQPVGFVMYVLAFNQRAITVYERAGFTRTRTLTTPSKLTFIEMHRRA